MKRKPNSKTLKSTVILPCEMADAASMVARRERNTYNGLMVRLLEEHLNQTLPNWRELFPVPAPPSEQER